LLTVTERFWKSVIVAGKAGELAVGVAGTAAVDGAGAAAGPQAARRKRRTAKIDAKRRFIWRTLSREGV
jgi:hypothetical protein